MPQMAPLWWLSLMIFFLVIYFMFLSIIYFNKKFKFDFNYYSGYKNMNWMW